MVSQNKAIVASGISAIVIGIVDYIIISMIASPVTSVIVLTAVVFAVAYFGMRGFN